jgi:hypothetical protein
MSLVSLLLATCVFLTIVRPASGTFAAGVHEGEWVSYEFAVETGSISAGTYVVGSTYMNITIWEVNGSTISGGIDFSHLPNATTFKDFTIDIETGNSTGIARYLVVPANLKISDTIPGTNLTVSATLVRNSRDLAFCNASSSSKIQEYYWDRARGVLFESKETVSGGLVATTRIEKTNMWSTEDSAGLNGAISDSWIWIITAASVIGIILILTTVLIHRRRKKAKEALHIETEPTQSLEP